MLRYVGLSVNGDLPRGRVARLLTLARDGARVESRAMHRAMRNAAAGAAVWLQCRHAVSGCLAFADPTNRASRLEFPAAPLCRTRATGAEERGHTRMDVPRTGRIYRVWFLTGGESPGAVPPRWVTPGWISPSEGRARFCRSAGRSNQLRRKASRWSTGFPLFARDTDTWRPGAGSRRCRNTRDSHGRRLPGELSPPHDGHHFGDRLSAGAV